MTRVLDGGPLWGRSLCSLAPEMLATSAYLDPHLDQGSADMGLLEQEDVIRAVVEAFNAVSGCFEDSWVVGVDCFGKSWLHT